MKFVKCTEGLPPYNKPICGKLKGRPAIVTNSKLVEGFVSANGNLERMEDVEWLDESLPGKEEVYINGLKELLRMAGCPELLIENPNMLKGQVEAVDHEWALKAIEKYKDRPYIDNAERQ